MKKMNDLKAGKLSGGDWWNFPGCFIGCMAECQHFECSNAYSDCYYGCASVTL